MNALVIGTILGRRRDLPMKEIVRNAVIAQTVGGDTSTSVVVTELLNRRSAEAQAEEQDGQDGDGGDNDSTGSDKELRECHAKAEKQAAILSRVEEVLKKATTKGLTKADTDELQALIANSATAV